MKLTVRQELIADQRHVAAFRALAHLTRLEVFFFLVKAGGEVAAGDIAGRLGVPAPTLSHHLSRLRTAGLLQSRKEERYVYYSVQPETVSELVRLLSACC